MRPSTSSPTPPSPRFPTEIRAHWHLSEKKKEPKEITVTRISFYLQLTVRTARAWRDALSDSCLGDDAACRASLSFAASSSRLAAAVETDSSSSYSPPPSVSTSGESGARLSARSWLVNCQETQSNSDRLLLSYSRVLLDGASWRAAAKRHHCLARRATTVIRTLKTQRATRLHAKRETRLRERRRGAQEPLISCFLHQHKVAVSRSVARRQDEQNFTLLLDANVATRDSRALTAVRRRRIGAHAAPSDAPNQKKRGRRRRPVT